MVRKRGQYCKREGVTEFGIGVFLKRIMIEWYATPFTK